MPTVAEHVAFEGDFFFEQDADAGEDMGSVVVFKLGDEVNSVFL